MSPKASCRKGVGGVESPPLCDSPLGTRVPCHIPSLFRSDCPRCFAVTNVSCATCMGPIAPSIKISIRDVCSGVNTYFAGSHFPILYWLSFNLTPLAAYRRRVADRSSSTIRWMRGGAGIPELLLWRRVKQATGRVRIGEVICTRVPAAALGHSVTAAGVEVASARRTLG